MSLNNAAPFVVQNPVNIKENKAIDVKVEHLQRNFHARAPSYLINPKTHQEAVYDPNLFEETMDETAIYDYSSVSYILHPTSCT